MIVEDTSAHTLYLPRNLLQIVEHEGPYQLLKNFTTPLRGTKQHREHPSITAEHSRAIQELSENLRAKIYAAVCKLGLEYLEPLLNSEELIKVRLVSSVSSKTV